MKRIGRHELNLAMFEDPGDDDVELVILGNGEEAPKDESVDDDKVTMSKAELEKLRGESADRELTRGVLEQLTSSLKQKPVANQPLPQNYKTEEEFAAEIEQDILSSGGALKAIRKVVNRDFAPVIGHYEQTIAELQQTVARKDDNLGGIMSKYSDEVAEALAQLPAAQRTTRRGVEAAVNSVKMKHFDDIVREEAAKLAAAAAKQDDDSDDDRPAKPVRKPSSDPGRMSAGGGEKKKVYVTDAMRAEAKRNHMTIEDFVRYSQR